MPDRGAQRFDGWHQDTCSASGACACSTTSSESSRSCPLGSGPLFNRLKKCSTTSQKLRNHCKHQDTDCSVSSGIVGRVLAWISILNQLKKRSVTSQKCLFRVTVSISWNQTHCFASCSGREWEAARDPGSCQAKYFGEGH